MYHNYTEEELRSYCRTCLESLEMWARRLIHEKMVEKYGESYVDAKNENEEYIIKSDVRKHIQSMLAKGSGQFQRPIDTLFFEHIIYFLCKKDWYRELFKDAMDYMYPEGYMELMTFLNRLILVRNALSHSNPISIRQAEQAICYSHDFIDGLKKYYKDRGLEQVWNVPRIIRITDSLGNSFENPEDGTLGTSFFEIKTPFYCGDVYSVNVEIDSSFEPQDYNIYWTCKGKEMKKFENSPTFSLTFSEKHVAEELFIICTLISKKSWHRYSSNFDCKIGLSMTVYPPL